MGSRNRNRSDDLPMLEILLDGLDGDEDAPSVPEGCDGPTLDDLADVFLATAQFLRALLDRQKLEGH